MNRIIRQVSVVGLFVLAVTIGVRHAQADQQYRAEIPFDFEAAGKHYAAGKYSVGPLSAVSSGAIAIRNVRNGESRLLGISPMQASTNWDIPGKLTFLKVDGRYTLSQISTPTFKMKMKGEKSRSDLAKNASSDSKVVAIDLNR